MQKLQEVTKNKQYPDLIKFLIAEGLLTLMEAKVVIKCRQVDLAIVKKQVSGAVEQYKNTVKKSVNVVPDVDVSVDENDFLPPPPSGKPGASCAGGVVLSARDGQILLKNTLDQRVSLALHDLQPKIRAMLFGARPMPASAAAEAARKAAEPEHEDSDDDYDEDLENEINRRFLASQSK